MAGVETDDARRYDAEGLAPPARRRHHNLNGKEDAFESAIAHEGRVPDDTSCAYENPQRKKQKQYSAQCTARTQRVSEETYKLLIIPQL
jgi:hypothetical protein